MQNTDDDNFKLAIRRNPLRKENKMGRAAAFGPNVVKVHRLYVRAQVVMRPAAGTRWVRRDHRQAVVNYGSICEDLIFPKERSCCPQNVSDVGVGFYRKPKPHSSSANTLAAICITVRLE